MKSILLMIVLITSLFSNEMTINKKIKVSYDPDYAPFSFTVYNKPQGLLIDIYKAWGKANNIDVEFINGKNWDDALELTKQGKADFFLGTDPYENWMKSSRPFYKTKTSLFRSNYTNKKIKFIGIIGDDYKNELEEVFPKSKISSYETYEELVNALIDNRVDAIYNDGLAISDYIFQHRLNYLIKKVDGHSILSDISAISSDIKKIKLFNKGFKNIEQDVLKDIENAWITNESEKYYALVLDQLNSKEKEWLEKNPVVRLAVMSYWPHDKAGNSLHTDVLKLINQYIGTNLIPIKFDAWKYGYDKAIMGESIHGTMGLSYSNEREEKYFHYSPAYSFTPSYIVVKKENNSIKSIKDLKKKTIYLKSNSILHKMVGHKLPSAKILNKNTIEEIYKEFSESSKADAVVSYFIDKEMMNLYDLKVAEVIYDRYGEVSIGINHKYPELDSIIKKAFKIIPKRELSKLRGTKYTSTSKIEFTKKELRWLQKKESVKYNYDSDWKPLAWTNELGEHQGITADLLKLISDKSDIIFEQKNSSSWNNAIDNIKNGKVDMLSDIGETKERKKYLNFTSNSLYSAPFVFVVRENESYLNGFDDTKDKKIAVYENSTIHGILKDKKSDLKINFIKNDQDGFDAIQNKKYDVFIVNSTTAKYYINVLGYKDLKIGFITDFTLDLKIAIHKSKPKEILSIINKTIKHISKKEIESILKKRTKKVNILFTNSEQRYLKDKKSIKICTNPNLAPIEFNEDDKPYGISLDVLNTIKSQLKLDYKFVETTSWSQSQEFLKDKKCDILPSAIKTKIRERYANFTIPYLKYDLVIVTKSKNQKIANLNELIGKTMTRKEGSGLISKINKQYPNIIVKQTKTTLESFRDVEKGNVDFTISTLPVFLYHKSKYEIKDLKVNGTTPIKYNLSIAVEKDNIVLLNILNKALKNVPESTYKLVHDKWASVKVINKTDWILIFQITGVIILILLFLMWNNRKLNLMVESQTADIRKQKEELEDFNKNLETTVDSRTKELSDERKFIDSVMNSQSSIVITTNGKTLRTVNKSFLKFYGVKSTSEFTKKYGECICDTFAKNLSDDYVLKYMNGVTWIDFIAKDSTKSYKTIIQKDNNSYIFSIAIDKFVFKGEELNTAVFTDITELERARENTEQILANILLPVLITSKEKRTIIYANKFAQDLYETSKEDIIDAQLDNIYTLTNGPEEIIKQITETGRVNALEEHITTYTGKEFVGLLSVTPINYNDEDCYIGMTVDITEQKDLENEIREIHKHTRESIEYASMIQGAVLPEQTLMSNYFKDYFVSWTPKDTVGGDIWLFNELRHEDECLLFFIDCTGHGVPGAFVTMIVKAIEREITTKIIDDKDMNVSPAWIMSYFNKTMKKLLKQDTKDSLSNAGWDGGIIYYNKKDKVLKFAGAETPLFYIDTDGSFNTIKGNRYSVGYKKCDMDYEYKETILEVEEGMKFYCTTDGYLDQNGGEKDFPFGKKRFGNIIKENYPKPMEEQKEIFFDEMMVYETMIENNDRNDDMTVIGFEI